VLIVDTQRSTAAVATKLCEVSLKTQTIKATVSAPGRGSPSDRSAHAPQPAGLTRRGQLTHLADMAEPAGPGPPPLLWPFSAALRSRQLPGPARPARWPKHRCRLRHHFAQPLTNNMLRPQQLTHSRACFGSTALAFCSRALCRGGIHCAELWQLRC
jgi:hypothetical protein